MSASLPKHLVDAIEFSGNVDRHPDELSFAIQHATKSSREYVRKRARDVAESRAKASSDRKKKA